MTKPETYQKVADRYMRKLNELVVINQYSNFADISRNILSGVNGYLYFITQANEVTSNNRKRFLKSLKGLRTYYHLIDKFPDFRQGEFTSGGAFPDLKEFAISVEGSEQGRKIGIGGAQRYYVHLAKQRLEGKLGDSK